MHESYSSLIRAFVATFIFKANIDYRLFTASILDQAHQ